MLYTMIKLLVLCQSLLFCISHASSGGYLGKLQHEDLACPSWTDRRTIDSECKCGSSFKGRVICNPENHKVFLLNCYCMTYDLRLNKSVVGPCIYSCIDRVFWEHQGGEYDIVKKTSYYFLLPKNKSHLTEICSYYNREGRLCGDCEYGYSPSAFSYTLDCVNCTLTWRSITSQIVLYIFLPQTVFYFLALFFRLRITSPKFTAFVLVSQVIGSHAFIKIVIYNIKFQKIPKVAQLAIKVIIQFYSTWNLDFFKFSLSSFCIPNIDTKSAMALELVPAVYPLFLVFLTVVLAELHARGYRAVTTLWFPFYAVLRRIRCEWDVWGSINHVFGTVLILSYYKILATGLDLLTVGYARDLNGTVLGLWNFYQASASTNRFNFTYLVIFVLIVMLVPCFILIFYPVSCFRKHFLERVFFKSDRSRLALKFFMDSLQGYYKNGTEPNTRDHRYMAGLYLLLRFIMYLEFIWTLYSNFTPLIVTTLTAFSFFIFITKPYNTKYKIYNTVEPLFMGCLILLFMAMRGGMAALHERELLIGYMIAVIIAILIPPGYFVSILFYIVLKSERAKNLRQQMQRFISAVRRKRRARAIQLIEPQEPRTVPWK